MKKSWKSPVYGFFNEVAAISYENGRRCIEFMCSSTTCPKNLLGIRRFCDTLDRNSTGNMKRHAEVCFGKELVNSSLNSDIETVRKALLKKKDGSITAMFQAKGKGVVTYSNMAMTKAESRYVA